MTLRTLSRVIVVALVVFIGTALFLRDHVIGKSAAPALTGTDLQGVAAPDFALLDQTGTRVSLADLRGHPVVVTFMYTHCPDECPLTAEKLATTASGLRARAADVRFVAISSDPTGDTSERVTAFASAHHLTGTLHYLLGSRAELAPVWRSYGVSATTDMTAQATPGAVSHSLGVFVIDRQGRERVYLDGSFDPQVLRADLQTLLTS